MTWSLIVIFYDKFFLHFQAVMVVMVMMFLVNKSIFNFVGFSVRVNLLNET